jgi:hypothetical protein
MQREALSAAAAWDAEARGSAWPVPAAASLPWCVPPHPAARTEIPATTMARALGLGTLRTQTESSKSRFKRL